METSLPKNLGLSFRGFEEGSPYFEQFAGMLGFLGTELDLTLLDGATVGFDFQDALDSVELGYESKVAKTFTKDETAVCVAKILRVRRGERVRAHVVFDAHYVLALGDPEHEHFLDAAHIVAHEMGHVHDMARMDRVLPETLLRPPGCQDAFTNWLRSDALAIWDEYAACRLTGHLSNQARILEQYGSTFADSGVDALERARVAIRAYREHADIDDLYRQTHAVIVVPLKYCGYLLGHLDSMKDSPELGQVLPTLDKTFHGDFVLPLRDELRRLWDCRESWNGIEELDGIVRVIQSAFAAAGMNLTVNPEGGSRVDIPFTAETMPNGALDMLRIQLFGNSPRG